MDRGSADAGHHRLRVLLTGAALMAALQGAAYAQDAEESDGVFSLVVENDSLSSGADRNYTSGIKLSWVDRDVPDWLDSTGGALTRWIADSDPDFWGFAVGQTIFTPENISAVPAPPNEHPYAGHLYVELMVAAEGDAPPGRAPRTLDIFEVSFGMVGPSALGEEAQSGIHQWLGAPEPLGWDSQLEDEFVFAFSYDRRWRPLRIFADYAGGIEADIVPSTGFTVGTLHDEVRVGLTARIGQRIDNDWGAGPPRVRPALAAIDYFEGGPLSWSVFAGVQGRAVAHNLFLDGNTFEDSASVDRNPFVGDFQTGFSMSAGDWRLAYTYVWRTEEFSTQPTRQDFGALAISKRF